MHFEYQTNTDFDVISSVPEVIFIYFEALVQIGQVDRRVTESRANVGGLNE